MTSSFLVFHVVPRKLFVIDPAYHNISEVKCRFIPQELLNAGFFLTNNGQRVGDDDDIKMGSVYHCVPTLLGGKGGFGSMLRAIGAQIEKTTSREACRDLSGRRMRDVNNEKKLKEWLGKQADREQEKEERRQERLARRRQKPQHNFDDPTYSEQKNKMADDLEDALKTALKRDDEAGPSSSTKPDTHGKRKATSTAPGKIKRAKEWLGVDIDSDDLSSDDSEICESSSEGAKAGVSSSRNISSEEESCDSVVPIQPSATEEVLVKSENSSDIFCPEGSAEVNIKTESDSNHAASKTCENGDSVTLQGETIQPDVKPKVGLLASLPPPQNRNMEQTGTNIQVNSEDVDLSEITSSSELVEFGMERLKFALTQRGLKCGGTLQERADRLFSVKGLSKDQIDPSLFPKQSNGKSKKK